jgi:hypothetical protein
MMTWGSDEELLRMHKAKKYRRLAGTTNFLAADRKDK